MDALPVELMRIIFKHCDHTSVKNLRAVGHLWSQVGYDYLVPPKFTSIGWGVDIDNLHNISQNDRLKACVEQVVLNFAELDARNTTYLSNIAHVAGCRDLLEDREVIEARLRHAHKLRSDIFRHSAVEGRIEDQYSRLRQALLKLPNFSELDVTFTNPPSDNALLHEAYDLPSYRKLDHRQAADYLDAIIHALQDLRLQVLRIDWFPFEILRQPSRRKHWFRFESSLHHLKTLDLTIDQAHIINSPHTQLVAFNGLGRLLRVCTKLTSLSLAFRTERRPHLKARISFHEMLGNDFVFPVLADLKLEGMSCIQQDLSDFLLRHSHTLRRLRLGGRGLSRYSEPSVGGMTLCRGQWRHCFSALQEGLTGLERLHLEADFASIETRESPRRERYHFHPTTDDNWNDINPGSWQTDNTIDSRAFERYILEGGEYPGNP